MKFSTHAIAYLDILGFSKFVEEAEKDNNKLELLDKLFNEVIPRSISLGDRKGDDYKTRTRLKCLTFSDSFVVSAPVSDKSTYPALIAVSIKAIQIVHSLLDMGFLVRGAIAVGNAYRTASNILGTGFQEAVEREKTTKHPQIVLTESAKEALDKLIKKGWPRYAIYAKDELGQVILNSIHPEKTYLPNKNGDVADYFKKYRQTILEKLSIDNLESRQKWIWFIGLFNANVKEMSSLIGYNAQALKIDEKLFALTLNYLNQELDPNWAEPFKAPGFRVKFNHPGRNTSAQGENF